MKVERVCRHRRNKEYEIVVLPGNKKCITKKGAFQVGDEVDFTPLQEIIAGLRSSGTLKLSSCKEGTEKKLDEDTSKPHNLMQNLQDIGLG